MLKPLGFINDILNHPRRRRENATVLSFGDGQLREWKRPFAQRCIRIFQPIATNHQLIICFRIWFKPWIFEFLPMHCGYAPSARFGRWFSRLYQSIFLYRKQFNQIRRCSLDHCSAVSKEDACVKPITKGFISLLPGLQASRPNQRPSSFWKSRNEEFGAELCDHFSDEGDTEKMSSFVAACYSKFHLPVFKGYQERMDQIL